MAQQGGRLGDLSASPGRTQPHSESEELGWWGGMGEDPEKWANGRGWTGVLLDSLETVHRPPGAQLAPPEGSSAS